MRRRRPMGSLLIFSVAFLLAAEPQRAWGGPEAAARGAAPLPMQASLSASSVVVVAEAASLTMPASLKLPSSSSSRRSLKCHDVPVAYFANSNVTFIAGNHSTSSASDTPKAFRSFGGSSGDDASVINDACSQAAPIVRANATDPLDKREVMHARAWTPVQAVATALRRRGRTVRVLSELDLAAAAPLLLPSLVRFRPLSDAGTTASEAGGAGGGGGGGGGGEAARVMDLFSDGSVTADISPGGSDKSGLPQSVTRLESHATDSREKPGASKTATSRRKTISAKGLRNLLAHPERVLIAMASNKTGADRITKEEYAAFLLRDTDVALCPDPSLEARAANPVDRIFEKADTNRDGTLDAGEIKAHNLTDAATAWVLGGDADGDGTLSAQELADGLPHFVDLLPKAGHQRLTLEQQRRIEQVRALAAVAAYDVEDDGRLGVAEMQVYSGDFTRRSMGQTMVPVWALSWHFATISIKLAKKEGGGGGGESAAAHLVPYKGPTKTATAAPATPVKEKDEGEEKRAPPTAKEELPIISALYYARSAADQRNNATFPSSNNDDDSSDFSPSYPSPFEEGAALRSFMLKYAPLSATTRAALAAAAAANKSYGLVAWSASGGGSGSSNAAAELAAAFGGASRGPDPRLTQHEWISFFSAVHKTGARAYWLIARRSGVPGAAAPECCSVLAPGLREIARVLPPQLGQEAVELSAEEAEAEAVRFDADGEGVEQELPSEEREENASSSPPSSMTASEVVGSGKNNGTVAAVAALSAIDLMQWGIMRLGTLCGAQAPIFMLGQ